MKKLEAKVLLEIADFLAAKVKGPDLSHVEDLKKKLCEFSNSTEDELRFEVEQEGLWL